MLWFIDEYVGELPKDKAEEFAGATIAPVFNRRQNTTPKPRSSDDTLQLQGSITGSDGLGAGTKAKKLFLVFSSSFGGVREWVSHFDVF